MLIDANELKAAAARLLDHLLPDEVELGADFYWDVSFEERYDPTVKPIDSLSLGSLEHDWERVIASDRDVGNAVPMALMWLGNIIRAVGEVPPLQARAKDAGEDSAMSFDDHPLNELPSEDGAYQESASSGDAWFDELVLSPRQTGLSFDYIVLRSRRGGGAHSSEADCVTLWRDAIGEGDIIRVAIHPEVRFLDGHLSSEELDLLLRWIELNREVIEGFWSGDIVYSEDVLDRLKSLDDLEDPEHDRWWGAAILSPEDTGLPFHRTIVWMKMWMPVDDVVHVSVSRGRAIEDAELIKVAVEPEVRVLEGGELATNEFDLLSRWIEVNREVIFGYWSGVIEGTMHAIERLKPIVHTAT